LTVQVASSIEGARKNKYVTSASKSFSTFDATVLPWELRRELCLNLRQSSCSPDKSEDAAAVSASLWTHPWTSSPAHTPCLFAAGRDQDQPDPERRAGADQENLEPGDPIHAAGREDCRPQRPHRSGCQRARLLHACCRRPLHLAGIARPAACGISP